MPRRGETQKESKQLAQKISEVLKDENTPPVMKEAMQQALEVMSNHVDFHSPEMIEKHLSAYCGHENERYEIVCTNELSANA